MNEKLKMEEMSDGSDRADGGPAGSRTEKTPYLKL